MYKILVVDDEPIVRLALKSLMDWESHGFCMGYEAGNGKQAIDILNSNSDISIVITDITMPELDGLSLTSFIKENFKHILVIVLSAYNDYELIREAFRLGASDYILKIEMQHESVLRLLLDLTEKRLLKDFADNNIKEHMQNKQHKHAVLLKLLAGDLDIPFKDCGFQFSENNILVIALIIEGFKLAENQFSNEERFYFYSTVANIINQNIQDKGETLLVSNTKNTHCFAVIVSFNMPDALAIKNKANELIRKIRYCLSVYDIQLAIGVSSIKNGLDAVSGLYAEAQNNATICDESQELLFQEQVSLISQVKDFVNEKYSEKLSLKIVSQHFNLSESYLSAMFSKETGESFSNYLIKVRIEESKILLSNTDKKILEVSYKVGYHSFEHFSRIFKKVTGMSPSQYRNKVQNRCKDMR